MFLLSHTDAADEVATYDDDNVEICQTCYDEHYTRCEGVRAVAPPAGRQLAFRGRLLSPVLRQLLQRTPEQKQQSA